MFSGLLSSDSEIIVFERNVSDLFSTVPVVAVKEIASWSMVQHADSVHFGIVSSADHPIITCFGITPLDARLRNATWIKGDLSDFAQHADDVVLGERAAPRICQALSSSRQVAARRGTTHVTRK